MAQGEIVDILLRGANVGALLLLAIALAARGPADFRRVFGAAFGIGTACYILVTSRDVRDALGLLGLPVQLLSMWAPVFFWWFALALFDDAFRWRWRLATPLLLICPIMIAYYAGFKDTVVWRPALLLLQATLFFVYGHAVWTAMHSFNDDLIEGRRRFRIVFAILVAATGLIITTIEAVTPHWESPPLALRLFQACAILMLTLGFGAWMTATRSGVLDGGPSPRPEAAPQSPQVRAADRPAFETLRRLMDEGVYREEGLTVAGLAGKVGVPEHQLRALINGQLGARNFSAFLNARRVEDAKAALADPAQARKQILQVALDLGYGSIAPFNRAFKEATGMTPTEFRKTALGES